MGNGMGGSDSEVDQLADQIGELLNFGRSHSKQEAKQGGLQEFAKWIETGKVKNILVLCGAGVSVSAGMCGRWYVGCSRCCDRNGLSDPMILSSSIGFPLASVAHGQAFPTFEHQVRDNDATRRDTTSASKLARTSAKRPVRLTVVSSLSGTGLYDNLQKYSLPYPEAIFQVSFYRERPQAFVTLAHELWPGLKHSPTLTHSFLKLLSDKGLMLRNYTQNIDGLEHLAGLPAEQLVECHGHFRTASCIDCGKAAPSLDVQTTIVQSKEVPLCTTCGGHVKPDIVFFGEQLPDRFYKLLQDDVAKADCMLILGTSLQVAPVSTIPQMVNCPRVLFNREDVLPRFYTKRKMIHSKKNKDIFVKGDCDVAVEQLCELLGWTEQLKIQNKKTQIVTTQTKQASNDSLGATKK